MEQKALTTGTIAERLGVKKHVVDYYIRSRNIQPALRAGQFRVFDEPAFMRIKEGVAKTA